ncbi:glycosyltransferase [Nostoc sp. UCD121]|uniref:glycosyltransferase family 4 protein n=1 Tax=unclassified Nostoc TaxID=2593658 RepID=UPI001627C2E0|nr:MULTISPECIES: glycosyltransferase [unclassified Nostoc]MBC1225148.1 glycosyltransferase [Nostoc sp. UCD120]MBC1278930.1 glycosyltransferase [Nostoc sp. UCD121]MBC1295092.1 glycosyltransferase [Nostoc sp. UCD122]
MRLLFIIPEYPPHSGGGIATFYSNTLPEIVAQGHQVDVLVGSAFTSKLPNYQKDGVNVEFLNDNLISSNLYKFNRYQAIPEFQRHLAAAWTAWEQVNKGQGYDLVETTDWGMLFAPWIISPESPPTVVQLHASIGQIDFHDPQVDSQLQGNLVRLLEVNLLSVADQLQTYSQSNAQAWKQLIGRDVSYIPPAMPLVPNIQPFKKSAHGLVVGRIQYWKGTTIVCEALRLLGEKAPIIDWIGRDTTYRDSNTSMASYLAQTYPDIWGNKTQPLGTFSPEETRQLQAMAKFIIVPSIWDVFNYTCVEGMAQGQTVLCSLGAGAADLITDEVNGLTFTAGDAQSLANRLDILLSWSQGKQEKIGKAAQETIETFLNPKLIAQQRLEVYEKLIKHGKHSVSPNSWLIEAVSPQKPLEKPLAFLDYLPLRELANYLLERSLKKLVKR